MRITRPYLVLLAALCLSLAGRHAAGTATPSSGDSVTVDLLVRPSVIGGYVNAARAKGFASALGGTIFSGRGSFTTPPTRTGPTGAAALGGGGGGGGGTNAGGAVAMEFADD